MPNRIKEEYFDDENNQQINLVYSLYDHNKQRSEWQEIIEHVRVSNHFSFDWLHEFLQSTELPAIEVWKESTWHDLEEIMLSCIFDVIYWQKSINEASQSNSVNKSLEKALIKSCLQLRMTINRKFMNKSKLLMQEHKDYLFSLWSSFFARPYILTELSSKLSNKFKELPKISTSTISRVLRNDLWISYRKLWNITPKFKERDEASKLA